MAGIGTPPSRKKSRYRQFNRPSRFPGTKATLNMDEEEYDSEGELVQKRELEEDEEMPLAERDLADDAPWKKIQQNTFTRWCNEHLKCVQKHIGNLETDLSDGLRLIGLVEVLSQKRIPRFNKRPTFRSMKLENVSLVLNFLERENIKIVNIDSTDIVDSKLKLILGLIWLLILHYSISMPMWDDEGYEDDEQPRKKQSPKEKLLGWIQNKVPELPIKNFNKDWNDGRAIGALVDAVAPGLCPDWEDWNPKDRLKNAKEAMDLAQDWLGVPQVLRPEDMVNPKIDDLSMMTYLSEFPKAKLKEGAPLRPRANAKKVRAYGPGVEKEGNAVSKPTHFTVETFSAGAGKVEVRIIDPQNKPVEFEIKFNNDKAKTYTVEYIPKTMGQHTVTVIFKGLEIPNSPFPVHVSTTKVDPSKCYATGPGIEPTGVILNQKTYFEIFTAGAGPGVPTVTIVDPNGDTNTARMVLNDMGKSVYKCEYIPTVVGNYKIEVLFDGIPIPKSPYDVRVSHAFNPKRAFAYGRGLQAKGLRVRENLEFFVNTKEAGEAELKVQIIGPGGISEPVEVSYNNDGLYTCKYKPFQPGQYTVVIQYGKEEIPKSPFKVNIAPEAKPPLSNVRAFGPGLEGGVVGEPCDFTVETNGSTGALGFSIEGPSEAKIKCKDNGDGSCEVTYFPTAPGEYAIHITCDEEDIVNSPFMAQIVPNKGGFDASKVVAYGPGLEKDGVEINKPTEFFVDAKQGGKGELGILIHDQWGNPLEPAITDNRDGTYSVSYMPKEPLKHTVAITWGGVSIPKSPFKVNVGAGASKVKVYGPGVEPNKVKAHEPTHFTIDCREAGKAPVEVNVISAPGVNGPQIKEMPCKVTDNGDGTFAAQYTPEGPGEYAVAVKYAGQEIPKSPIPVRVVPSVDVSKIKIDGLQDNEIGKEAAVKLDTSKAGHGKLKAKLISPSGKEVPVRVEPTGEGYVAKFIPDEEGPHLLEMSYGGCPLTADPIKVEISPKVDPTKCKAFGPGLTSGHVDKPAEFTIDVRGAGLGGLGVTVEGPSESEISCNDNGDGTCVVFYTPTTVGDYAINILFAEQHIPGSPYTSKVIDSSKVKADGPGLGSGCFCDFPCTFEVDCIDAGPAAVEEGDLPVTCTVKGPNDKPLDVKIEPCEEEDVYKVTYRPEEQGPHTLDLSYAGYPVSEFPKMVGVKEPIDLSKVDIEGLEDDAVFCDCPTDFAVNAKALGPLDKELFKADITAPSGKKVKPTIQGKPVDDEFTVAYVPKEEGPHKVDVTFAGMPLGKSPYTVNAIPGHDASKCKAYGPGLEGGVTGQPATFTVETKGAGKGGLGIAIEGPSEAKMECKDNKDGSCTVEYFPTKPGDYEVHVTFADDPIPGSPFKPVIVDTVDPSKVVASGPGLDTQNGVRHNTPTQFHVDATHAGKAPLDVTLIPEKGAPEKAQIIDNQDGTFDVSYVPKVEGKLQVDIKYGGKEIPQSPVNLKVNPQFDPDKVKVSGPGVEKTGILASLPVDFIVDTSEAGDAELSIIITDADGRPIKPEVIDNGDGTYKIVYTPKDVGHYNIIVKYGGRHVPNSPWDVVTSPTGDASKCDIFDVRSGDFQIPVRRRSVSSESTTSTKTTTTRTTTTKETITKTVVVEEETTIKVNSRDAGTGRVTCTIVGPDGNEVPNVGVVDNGDGTFDIVWMCPKPGSYLVDIKFGGVSLTGGPITITAAYGPPEELITTETVTQEQFAPVMEECRPLDLVIPVLGAGTGNISGEVKRPSGKKDIPNITENKDGTITVKYAPAETGLHELSIKYDDRHVPGSPFQFHVDELKSGQVTAFGPGLTHGICDEPCEFTINTKDAGAGGLALAIEGPSKAKINCVDNKDGTCSVTYFPTKPGQYEIVVKFGDKDIAGSPFKAQIVDKAGSKVSVGTPSDVPLKINETDLSKLSASIRQPSGREEPCALKRLPNGNIGITFTPKEVGEHLVSVKKGGNHISNSPFKIIVGSQDVGDATKVKVRGRGIAEADAGQTADFIVDTRNAGYGGLGVSIEGPSKTEINCEDNGDGTCLVTYKPLEPGTYTIHVRYADKEIPGSPFKVQCISDDEYPMIKETLQKATQAVPVANVGTNCELGLKIPGTDPLDMTAQVTNPNGKTEDAEIADMSGFRYVVRFIPTMAGVHTINVKSRGIHVPGSPFQFTVGPRGEGGTHKVHAGGPGLERGEVGVPAEFTIWTREAGPGKLGITIGGPAKAPINIVDNKDGSYQVTYTPSEPGDYTVEVKFNDHNIPDSPFHPYVTPQMAEARRLSVSSLQDSGLKPGVPASFAVQLNGAKGDLKAKAITPSGTEEECIITPIDDENFAVRFLPKENGIYNIHVYFKNAPIPGSPFKIRVGADVGDPGMVNAYGDGLEKGFTGQQAEFVVNTCGAGAGTLAVTIDGPAQVKMNVVEVADGYKVMYTAPLPGAYLINVRYAGQQHISGSPFRAQITGQAKTSVPAKRHEYSTATTECTSKTAQPTAQLPQFQSDASKVTITGMGIKKAFVNKKSQFSVDAGRPGCGQNMLSVGIAGPKTPCDEVVIKHQGRNRYVINYTLKERGSYVLIVKWGDQHISGSPFLINCT